MNKDQLVEGLSRYAASHRHGTLDQTVLPRFLAYYFSNKEIPAEQVSPYWRIEEHVPQLLVGAMEVFRTSEDATISRFRSQYERGVNETKPRKPLVDPTRIEGNGIEEVHLIQSLGILFEAVTGSASVKRRIDEIFQAERSLLNQEFYKFLVRVYARGLYDLVNSSDSSGLSGTFGKTVLRIFADGGLIRFTFARPLKRKEHSISYVCRAGDPDGLDADLQAIYGGLTGTLAMIHDVIHHWPDDPVAQAKIIQADPQVTIYR